MKKKKLIFVLPILSLISCTKGLQTTSENSTTENNSTANSETTSLSTSTTTSNQYVNIDIIELNDTHGYEYQSSYNSNYNLSNVSYYVNQKRALNNNEVVLVANGDMFEGTAFSALSYGGSVINTLNCLDFDMMGIGNHEFSWGLDKILNFFDNDEQNYEANFPLINGNIYQSNSNERYSESNINDKIVPYTICQKGEIKVGLLSYIGDLSSSISSQYLIDYQIHNNGENDNEFINLVREDAKALKDNGADVILLNIHGGNSNSINDYQLNNVFANIKDDNDNYLIDAIVNGHTHTKQSGYIKRTNGVDVPVVQALANCNGLGEINLKYDLNSNKVVNVTANSYELSSLVSSNLKDSNCQNVIDSEYNKINTIISEELCYSSNSASKAQLGHFVCDIMVQYASADVAFFNASSFRNILPVGAVKVEDVYNLYPFENQLIYVKVKGSSLKKWYQEEKNYQAFNSTFDSSQLIDNNYYNVITIDYVYYSKYFTQYITDYEFIRLSDVRLRDIVIEELRLKKDVGFNIYNYNISISPTPFIN